GPDRSTPTWQDGDCRNSPAPGQYGPSAIEWGLDGSDELGGIYEGLCVDGFEDNGDPRWGYVGLRYIADADIGTEPVPDDPGQLIARHYSDRRSLPEPVIRVGPDDSELA